jgi:AcrR family transcriptional regulator
MSRLPVQERSQQTKSRLLAAARRAFAERGFADASMEQIAELAGVTRGPLYHFFDDKADLFRAVYAEIEHELTARIAAEIRERSGAAADALDDVRLGAQAFLDAGLEPSIQRIAFVEAPYVLVRGSSPEVAGFGLDLLRAGLHRAMDAGLVARQPIEPLASVLRAAITEGAVYIARADDHASARAEVGAAIDALIEGLRL